jgi:peroxiredoxin
MYGAQGQGPRPRGKNPGQRVETRSFVFDSSRARLAALTIVVGLGLSFIPNDSAARSHQPSGPSTGLKTVAYAKVPPDFTYDVGQGETKLSAQFGKPIVLHFWATWCRPCLEELDVFERFQREYGDRATLVTISSEDPGVARTYVKAHDLKVPVAEDPQRHVFDAYSIGPIPVTLVLGTDGTVSHVSVGELDWNELKAAMDGALRVTARAET